MDGYQSTSLITSDKIFFLHVVDKSSKNISWIWAAILFSKKLNFRVMKKIEFSRNFLQNIWISRLFFKIHIRILAAFLQTYLNFYAVFSPKYLNFAPFFKLFLIFASFFFKMLEFSRPFFQIMRISWNCHFPEHFNFRAILNISRQNGLSKDNFWRGN